MSYGAFVLLVLARVCRWMYWSTVEGWAGKLCWFWFMQLMFFVWRFNYATDAPVSVDVGGHLVSMSMICVFHLAVIGLTLRLLSPFGNSVPMTG